MRRSVNGFPNDDPRPGFLQGWDRFFFTPADPTPLGLIRVVTGLMLVWSFACLGPDLHDYLGSSGWADPGTVRRMQSPYAWSFWFFVPDAWLWPAWAACLGVLGLFTLGLGSRVTAVLAWVIVVATVRRVPVMLFGFDNVVSIWTFYLAFSFASGQALALDRFRARRTLAKRPGGSTGDQRPEPTIPANLGLRLIQLHLCLIYLSAGLAKLQGQPWWDGSALGMLLGNSEFRPMDLSWLAAYPRLMNLGTHATIFLELAYPALIWFRGLRPWMLAGAVAMHLGIALSMGLTEFSLVMIAGNLAFVPGSWIHALTSLRRGPLAASGLQSREGSARASASPTGRTSAERGRSTR